MSSRMDSCVYTTPPWPACAPAAVTAAVTAVVTAVVTAAATAAVTAPVNAEAVFREDGREVVAQEEQVVLLAVASCSNK